MNAYDAERSVIGAALLDNVWVGRLADTLTAADFYEPGHQQVWAVMVKLSNAGKACDAITVADAMGDAVYDIGGFGYLAEMMRDTPAATNARTYAEIVADTALRRRLLDALANVEAMARDRQTATATVLDDAQSRLVKLVRPDAERAGPVGGYLPDFLTKMERRFSGDEQAMGLGYGLADLDSKTMGMHPGQMVIAAGRPGMGKTAFSLTVAAHCAVKEQRPVVLFNMEMDREAIITRLVACLGNLPIRAVRDPQHNMNDELWARMTYPVKSLNDAPLVIDDRAAMSLQQVRSSAKRWRDHYGDMGLVIVDYLQLMATDGRSDRNREQDVAEASRTMKMLAKELACPVMVLSQLNRKVEERPNKRPMPADLRESGSLEQDADLILFLYRDEHYHENSDAKGVAEIIVAKQREGETGTVYAAANLAHGRFDNLDAGVIAAMKELQQAPKRKKTKSALAEF